MQKGQQISVADHFDTDPDLLFTLIWIRNRLFDTDPDPYLQFQNLIFLFSRSARAQPEGILC
jgi:hypothetical protein